MIIGIDVDEVVADLHTPWVTRYNEAYGDNLWAFDRWDVENQVKPECGKKIFEFLTPGLYDVVQPISHALLAVKALISKPEVEVMFVSSCFTPALADRKVRWLEDHGFSHPKTSFVASSQKAEVPGLSILVDDYVENCHAFRKTGRRAVLVARPHNRNVGWNGEQTMSLWDFALDFLRFNPS